MAQIAHKPIINENEVLTKALVRAKYILDINVATLAEIIGFEKTKFSRMENANAVIRVSSAQGKIALLFLRMVRSLDALLGGHDENQKNWLNAYNRRLNAKPIDIITHPEGLVRVTQLLDAYRGNLG